MYIMLLLLLPQRQEELNPGQQPDEMEGDNLISMVNKAVGAIMTRLQSQYTSLALLSTRALFAVKSHCFKYTCTINV